MLILKKKKKQKNCEIVKVIFFALLESEKTRTSQFLNEK